MRNVGLNPLGPSASSRLTVAVKVAAAGSIRRAEGRGGCATTALLDMTAEPWAALDGVHVGSTSRVCATTSRRSHTPTSSHGRQQRIARLTASGVYRMSAPRNGSPCRRRYAEHPQNGENHETLKDHPSAHIGASVTSHDSPGPRKTTDTNKSQCFFLTTDANRKKKKCKNTPKLGRYERG